ncbi:hypothetical protein MASR2M78_06730 [Treponema sp.]
MKKVSFFIPALPALAALPTLLFLAFFSSCSYVTDRATLMEGSFLFKQAKEKEAIAAYLRVSDSKELGAYGDFGLASVYLSLGELDAALGRLASIEEDLARSSPAKSPLLYSTRYNSGIVQYRAGNIEKAASAFRRALEIDGSQTDAKRNLELCLRLLSRKSTNASSAAPLGKKEAGNEPRVLFDFIREKESDRWKSREWKAESPSAMDY